VARPNPEQRFRTYTEYYQSQSQAMTAYPMTGIRDYYREWAGTNTPGFPKVKRINAHHVYKSEVKNRPSITLNRRWVNLTNVWDHVDFVYRDGFQPPSNMPYPLGDTSHDASLRNKAINRAMEETRNMKINLAQSLAERKQVVNSIADIATRLAKAIHSVRRLDVKGAATALGLSKHPKKFSGNVASDWLALQYGWKPLLSDIKSMAEHIAQNSVGRPTRVKARGRVREKGQPWIGRGRQISLNQPFDWTFHGADRTVVCELEFWVYNDALYEGNQLGITDPLTLAWELVPYSFVVDWFLPVGDFISNLNYDSGLVFAKGRITQHSTELSSVTPVAGTRLIDGIEQTLSGQPTLYEAVRLDREKLLEPPRVVFPSFKDPFSPLHALNAIALMRVAFGR
jgi:hypothetical protein